jgi:hypothetical protein
VQILLEASKEDIFRLLCFKVKRWLNRLIDNRWYILPTRAGVAGGGVFWLAWTT